MKSLPGMNPAEKYDLYASLTDPQYGEKLDLLAVTKLFVSNTPSFIAGKIKMRFLMATINNIGLKISDDKRLFKIEKHFDQYYKSTCNQVSYNIT